MMTCGMRDWELKESFTRKSKGYDHDDDIDGDDHDDHNLQPEGQL